MRYVNLVADERTIKTNQLRCCLPQRDIPNYIAPSEAGIFPVDNPINAKVVPDEETSGFDTLSTRESGWQLIIFELPYGGLGVSPLAHE